MLKRLLFALLMLSFTWLNAQDSNLIINEIMYNPPESGTDSLEYIEIYNSGTEAIDLTGYSMVGVEYTFADYSLAAESYVVLAVNLSAFQSVFNTDAIECEGALSNGGETVGIVNAIGDTILTVTYGSDAPWPTFDDGTDGGGASIEFCGEDNSDPASWSVALEGPDVMINGKLVLGSPGMANTASCEEDPNTGGNGEGNSIGLSIAEATIIDSSGALTLLGDTVQFSGIVYGVNLRPGGLQMTIIDNENNGVGIFNGDTPYMLSEGERVIVTGTLDQFNGYAQVVVDMLTRFSEPETLVDPTIITGLGEDTESQLVTFENATLVDPSQWTNSGSGFNVDITNGADTIAIRIDNDVDIYNLPAPEGTFNVTGLGGQFDNSSPYDSGYQLFPRYMADIDPYNTTVEPPMESNYPQYTIPTVTTNNAEGIPDSLGVSCTLRGVVHGFSLSTSDLICTIIDENNEGIGVFNNDNLAGYEAVEGDDISIQGTIGFFNGLTQIVADSITVNSSGNAAVTADVVTALDETTESSLIEIKNVTIVDPSQWTGSGGGFNVDITDGVNTYAMRIDNEVDLFSMAAPTQSFNLTGIGGQFDNSEPHDSGYQILPRYAADIALISSNIDLDFSNAITVSPNPVINFLNVNASVEIANYAIFNADGSLIKKSAFNSQINLAELNAGMYYIQFESNDKIAIKKIVKL